MGDLIVRLKMEGPQVWQQLTLVQRATLVAVAMAALGAILFLSQMAGQPEYTVAYTGLAEGDASAVVAKLKELKIPYELAGGGSTIRVPAERVDDVRLQMAALGLPKGGSVGFELLDKMSFGLTDFAQKLNYQRALEGELSRTIGRIAGVQEARVHIVLPQNELFVEREKPTTASIVLMMKPGFEMDGKQVRGIANLVSRSVEGLKSENVTVLDGDGVMLSGQDEGLAAGAGWSSTQLEAQRGYEKALQRDIQGMLEQVMGARRVVVRVNASFDWDQRESSTETFSPNGKPAQVRSSREVTERSIGATGEGSALGTPSYPLDGGVPVGRTGQAAAAATPGPEATAEAAAAAAAGQSASAGQGVYEKRELLNNYELSKQVEKVVKAPGELKRLSVSVMLDGQLEPEMVASISESVRAAAGLDTARGDAVVVTSLPFDRTALSSQAQAGEELSQRELYLSIGRGVLVVVSLLVLLLLVRALLRGLTSGYQMGEYQMPQGRFSAPKDARPALPAQSRPPLTEEEKRPRLIQREVTELAKTQPKLVAGILKTWMDER